MRIARFIATQKFLAQALGLPKGAFVFKVGPTESNTDLMFYVEHESLPDIEEGAFPPLAGPEWLQSTGIEPAESEATG